MLSKMHCPYCLNSIKVTNDNNSSDKLLLCVDDLKKMELVYHSTTCIGFASIPAMKCSFGHVVLFGFSEPSNRTYHHHVPKNGKIPRRPRIINYDINILMALAMIMNGDTFVNMGRFAACLGLPNSNNIEKNMHTVSKKYLDCSEDCKYIFNTTYS